MKKNNDWNYWVRMAENCKEIARKNMITTCIKR